MSRRVFSAVLLAVFIILVAEGSATPAQSVQLDNPSGYTVQVAAFPNIEDAQRMIQQLHQSGEEPAWGEVEIPGRGRWIRILVGFYTTASAAFHHARDLAARGVIGNFLVKRGDEFKEFSKNTISGIFKKNPVNQGQPQIQQVAYHLAATEDRSGDSNSGKSDSADASTSSTPAASSLTSPSLTALNAVPVTTAISLPIGHSINAARLSVTLPTKPIPGTPPLLDPVSQGLLETVMHFGPTSGGLWVSGDVENAMARLRWILGADAAGVLRQDVAGHISIDDAELGKVCDASAVPAEQRGDEIATCIRGNEGLLLLLQVVYSTHRYLLHIGTTAPALAGAIHIDSAANYDWNYDSRINPRRPNLMKYGCELPPAGIDDLVAINPSAEWLNLDTGQPLSRGLVTFHELAEAYAKVDLGMEYLATKTLAGAHQMALAREQILKSERPKSGLITSEGRNRVFDSFLEFAKYESQNAGSGR